MGWELGLADANYYIENRYTTRSYCRARGTIFNILLNHNGKEYEKECIYMYMYNLNHCLAVQQKLTHCKSTILQ